MVAIDFDFGYGGALLPNHVGHIVIANCAVPLVHVDGGLHDSAGTALLSLPKYYIFSAACMETASRGAIANSSKTWKRSPYLTAYVFLDCPWLFFLLFSGLIFKRKVRLAGRVYSKTTPPCEAWISIEITWGKLAWIWCYGCVSFRLPSIQFYLIINKYKEELQ